MDAARRERRHHRKAAAAAAGAGGVGGVGGGGGGVAAARAAYGDVFGGPPRFAAPLGGAPLDYAEVFGGVAATCSIPYLDLPPAPSGGGAGGFFACRGKGDYGEIFGRFDFADFALPYEDLFGAPQHEPEPQPEAARETDPEIASSSGSSTSRSSFKKESSQLEDEPSILPQHYQNLDHCQHFKDHKFSPICFSPDTESPQFVMSYNKTTERRPDDLIEMTTCTAKPSLDFVIDSRNLSHDTAINHVSRIDNTIANDGNNKNPSSANTSVRSPESDFAVDQKQQSPSWTPISGSMSVNENHKNSDIHSTRSTVTLPDYAFLRVSDSDAQTQPIKVQPILRQQPKLLNKKEIAAKGGVNIVNHNCSSTSAAHTTSSSNMPHTDKKVDANPTSASAAMKEAMDFAEARLKAAKALLEGKGDSFKLRKKPSHLRSTRSTEIKSPFSEEVDTSEQKLSVKKSSKEEQNPDDSLFDKHKKLSAVRLDHFYDNGKKVLPLEKPPHMVQHCTESCQTSSKLEKLGNWKSGNDFFELTGDDPKCKTDDATEGGDKCEQMDPIISVINHQRETEFNAADSDLDRYEKLWEVNDGRNVGVKHVNLREDKTAPVDKDGVSVMLEPSTENMAHQKTHNSIGEGLVTLENAKERHDTDKCLELPTSGTSTKLDVFKDVSGSLAEACSSVNASDLRDHGNISPNVSPLAGTSIEATNSKLAPEVSCDGGMQHTSRSNEKFQESSDVSNVAISQGSNIKSLILEELKESDVCDAFTRGPNRIEQEAGTYGREKSSFIDGSLLLPSHFHNKGAKINLVSEKVQKVEIEKKVGPCAHPEVTIVDLDADCPKDANDDILQNDNFADPEESNMLNVFEVASKLIKRELDQEMHGSLGHGEEENMEEGMDAFVSGINGKEADETALENSEWTGTEEGSARCNQEDQNSSESTNRGKNDVDAKCDTACDEVGSESLSGDEVVIKATSDSTARTIINSKDELVFSSEMYTRMQHSMQKDDTTASQTSWDVPGLEETGEVSNRGEKELPTERSTCEDHRKASVMEEKDTTARISKAEHVPSPLETTCGVTKSAEAPTSVPTGTWKNEGHGVQTTKEGENMPTADSACEKDKGSSQSVHEKKENERRLEKERELAEEKERRKLEKERELAEEKERRKLEKEKELAKEKERRKLEKERELAEEKERRKLEEVERERERKKDRLAVERATREAHERAFAEAREKAEKMTLERIIAARQRASAEAREKEERASVEAAAERATREARIKAERAAVERATAEARERAIEKAKAEKALAEARERRERYKSSFKESFKSTNQDIRQESQFQRAASSNFIRNPDSSNRVAEVESALRHKARLERHQRTAERVTKALAEKNMRDLLAQREQAEKHRLSEFMDPEIKRWSNGKEGNLRALLSTLQYILGADSGWQPVPLTDLITAVAVKKAYRKATLCVHPDKLQQRGATIRQKYICEKVFDLLKNQFSKKSPIAQLSLRTKERENVTTADSACEKDKGGSSQRVHEKKENERRLEKERELAEEKERRKLEKEREIAEEKERRKLEKERELAEEKERRKLEEAERERERKKDRLAVERATREAHERAFAEAREKAEKMALERISSARQRASAEAREKEERASVETAAERATREARIKAERAAVERATAEARERAIEKAKAEKALAEARERRERYKSSFSESFKSTNQDIRQESQFQRATSSNFIRNPHSGNRVVAVESALRHKARLERNQRTAERVTKALAEKNMRDLLVQTEQAERHRLSEFLDPEIKRWSNEKEGNLRALLSTLQYVMICCFVFPGRFFCADSGWQPVPFTDLITAVAVNKAYRKATLCVHPDKLQQRGATIRQKYICEKVFDLLKKMKRGKRRGALLTCCHLFLQDAWNKFTSEER
ncbi:unnamed protein product [Miscanthus lutarioriparius]|uniref:J domain-containing protein n=1 Tax=Miscanthus lutarioriparius TaxID=422564 RepID=A0A811RUY3_9POAL|nr:unnamed protein product [Miscanthus lutarioriparius]